MSDPDAAPAEEDAINLVLQAERQARQAVEQCQQQAAQLLAAARTQAYRIEQRSEQRLNRWREKIHADAAQRIAALDAAAAALPQQAPLPAAERARLEQVAAALAASLTGGGDERL